ncbi:MAG: ribonuclease PH [Desulfomonilaceae bacterium]
MKRIRSEGRDPDQLRNCKIINGVLDYAEGSALIEAGKTRIICAASIEDRVPLFLKNEGRGWVTAEYAMLPRATHTRSSRERGPRIGGRTMEIQRLIGRSLRCVTDLSALGERTITIDCDVLQADGGTRVASISAAWVALYCACATLVTTGQLAVNPVMDSVAAVSVGLVGNEMLLDLDYEEDSSAEVDMNVVMTGRRRLAEVQATAEGALFSLARMDSMVRLAQKGITTIQQIQMQAIKGRAKES